MYVVKSHITGGAICDEHRRVYVLRSHITGARFVIGIGVCML